MRDGAAEDKDDEEDKLADTYNAEDDTDDDDGEDEDKDSDNEDGEDLGTDMDDDDEDDDDEDADREEGLSSSSLPLPISSASSNSHFAKDKRLGAGNCGLDIRRRIRSGGGALLFSRTNGEAGA